MAQELLLPSPMFAAVSFSWVRHVRPALARSSVCLAALVLLLASGVGGWAHAGEPAESGPEAVDAYLPGLIQYVRWPAEESLATWQVCTPGATARAAAPASPTARGKAMTVRPVAAGDSLAGCQILDLTGAPAATAKALLAQARKQPILTVGQAAPFCTAGGIVCLRSGAGASGFEINLSAVQEAGLGVSAQLLMLGRKRQSAWSGE